MYNVSMNPKVTTKKLSFVLLPIITIVILLFVLSLIIGGQIMNFLETRDFDNQAESFKKQLDALPSQSKWNKFTDTNLNISFKYPQGWTVNQAPKRDAVTIELSLWSRANDVVVNRTRRDQTDL